MSEYGFAVAIATEDYERDPESYGETAHRLLRRNYEQTRRQHPELGLTGDFEEQEYDGKDSEGRPSRIFLWCERVKEDA